MFALTLTDHALRRGLIRAAAIVVAFVALVSGAEAQCPSGRCAKMVDLGPTPPAGMKAPSERHVWKFFPEVGVHGWGMKDAAAAKDSPAPMPELRAAKLPEPKFVKATPHKDQHGKLFYRMVKDHAVHRLMTEKGYSESKARSLVESLSHESIDSYADHVGVSGQIGDGSFLQWLADHKDQILALLKLIVTILSAL